MGEPSSALSSFKGELDALFTASAAKLKELERLAADQQPRVEVNYRTLSAWRRQPRQAPSKEHHAFVLVMVEYMADKAKRRKSDYIPRPMGWWRTLLCQLREENDGRRGGRPPAAKTDAPAGLGSLPRRPANFTGRRDQLTQLLEQLEPSFEPDNDKPTLTTIAGMGGVGKTTLAIEAAHQAASHGWFPGDVLFADLKENAPGDNSDVSSVLDRFLRDVGIKAKDVPPDDEGKVALWQAHLRKRAAEQQPVLIVLDNIHEPKLARELRPDPPHQMLVTSRQTLSTLPSRTLPLKPFTSSESLELLDFTLRAAQPSDERISVHHNDAAELAELCGHLPLALHIVSALLRDEPDRPLADQVAELAEARTRLEVLAYDDEQGRPLAVRAAFDVSYRRLPPKMARTFRLLSCTPGADMSTQAISALLDQPTLSARRVVTALLRAHLLEKHPGERWAMHDLVRIFSVEQGTVRADQDERRAATERLFRHYLTFAEAAQDHLDPAGVKASTSTAPGLFATGADALAWLEQERSVLVAVAVTAAPLGHNDISYRLARALVAFLQLCRYLDDWVLVANMACTLSADLGDLALCIDDVANLGVALGNKGEHAEALKTLGYAARGFTVLRQPAGAAGAVIERSSVLCRMGNYQEALEAAQEAQRMLEHLDDERRMGLAKHAEGLALRHLGQVANALDSHAAGEKSFDRTGALRWTAVSMNSRGIALRHQGKLQEALAVHRAAAEAMAQLKDPKGQAAALYGMGQVYLLMEEYDQAVEVLSRVHHVMAENEDPVLAASATYHRGMAHQGLGNWDAALHEFDLVVANFREIGDISRFAAVQSQRGATLARQARVQFQQGAFLEDHQRSGEAAVAFEQAARQAQESAETFRDLDDTEQAAAMLAVHEESLTRARRAALSAERTDRPTMDGI
ncbi:tetratricopeptide repeat protein [Streptomyces sp. NPDC052196]|uniref:ATP-binding protein n=1 Tax=Streptomyces sp. NPDC052196 TaxID=3156691 RepID=UPI003441A6C3